ncbi:MAG: hypothetical protein R3E86_18685 [Pseudomonadales bacterium]
MYDRYARGLRARIPLLIALSLAWHPAAAATDDQTRAEVESLRQALAELRQDYETRIAALEARLNAASAAAPAAAAPAAPPSVAAAAAAAPAVPATAMATAGTSGTAGVTGNRDFNPAIGVIFQGQAWKSSLDEDETDIPGFPLGGEAGPLPRGLSIAETEIGISANVDDLFTARLTAPVVIEDGESKIEVEEAWIETIGMPAGLSARFGRFYSGIGYLNGKHSHAWDFVDQPLAYQAFLGNQYLDDGVQLRWLPPTDLYVELGAELLRGDRYPSAGAADGGAGAQSLFARMGGDMGMSSSWQAGLSYLHSKSRERASGPEDAPLLFSGDSDLVIAEFLWKWAPQGNWKQRNLIVQSEFLWRNEDGRYLLPDGSEPDIDQDQTGWYAQVIYQPMPQWRVGARVDLLSADNPGALFDGTPLADDGNDPRRYTMMVDWSHSEFSRLRFQYARDLSATRANNVWGLQYIHSIGAHGAHSF